MANTVWSSSDKHANVTLSGGNLTATVGLAGAWVRAVDKQVAGKFYYEITANTVFGTMPVGLSSPTANLANGLSGTADKGTTCYLLNSGLLYSDGVSTGISLGIASAGNLICIAVDVTNRLIWYRLGSGGNWNANATYNPATGVGGVAIYGLRVGIPLIPAFVGGNTAAVTANFGDSAFVGAVPSGYTSGFTAGASVPTNALASQALAEHWLTTNPQAQVTQVMAEHWMSVASGSLQAIATQVVLEHWMSVAVVVPASGGPQVTMIG